MQIEPIPEQTTKHDFTELDKVLESVQNYEPIAVQLPQPLPQAPAYNPIMTSAMAPKRTSSLNRQSIGQDEVTAPPAPVSSRTRRALHLSSHPSYKYETPDEEDELLDEALHGVQRLAKNLDKPYKAQDDSSRNVLSTKDANKPSLHHSLSVGSIVNPYPTPSPSARRNGVLFNQTLMDEPATPINIVRNKHKESANQVLWPTPPYEESEWAASAAASIFAAGSAYR